MGGGLKTPLGMDGERDRKGAEKLNMVIAKLK